ncbi:MAG: carboxyl transferase domain-containing protein, partial [Ilumatobacteraceae bacterium]
MTTDDVGIATGIPAPVSAQVTRLEGRKVMWIEFDASEVAHPLSSQMTAIISEGLRTALDELIPIVLIVNSSGADIAEGVAPLHGWGTAARLLTKCSGRVPTFAIVDGPAVSGPALLLGLVDVVIMTSTSYAFVNGPLMIRQFTGVDITKDELGSASTMERSAGLATAVVETREEGRDVIVEILNYLPDRVDAETPRLPTSDPIDRLTPEAGDHIPEAATGSYDVRSVVESIVDDGVITEIRSQWALNIVTAFASIDGRPVGIVANQPMALAGTLDIPASQKAARFVNFCDAFNLPIITFVDTPGFYPGKDLEWRGMIRHGAQLVYAYGQATVPRICVILRKSYGGAYIV